MGSIDFDGISDTLLGKSKSLLTEWFPEGKLIGKEFAVGSLRGGVGQSLRINTLTGIWKDFATGDSGSDLVSLYAAIHGIGQGDAAKMLTTLNGNGAGNGNGSGVTTVGWTKPNPKPAPVPEGECDAFIAPPIDAPAPDFKHSKFGEPTNVWTYRDADNKRLCYVARYDDDYGNKHFLPYSFTHTGWIRKALPKPRPLYNPSIEPLHSSVPCPENIDQTNSKAILVVEGEKAADAAFKICGQYYRVVSWPGGSSSYKHADWKPIYGNHVTIWPDADKPGKVCAEGVARLLAPHCPDIEIIDVSERSDGWDAADALEEGMDWESFSLWAMEKTRAPVQAVEVIPADKPTSAPQYDKGIWASLGLACTKTGGPRSNIDNVIRILEGEADWKERIWFDEFHDKVFIVDREGDKPREWNDVDCTRLTHEFQRCLVFHSLAETTVRSAVRLFADNNRRNEPKNWMNSLKWDGVLRLESFFRSYLGAKNDEHYLASASKNFWISLIARVFRPGCKVDTMPILQGAQGIRKSMALQAIGGDWFAEAHEAPTSKDFYMILQGKILVEISELNSFNGAEVGKIKQVITCQIDRYRKPYATCATDNPRQCVFVGTTNDDTYLKDATGGRRFWPVTVGKIDIKRIEDDRAQLFAEAVTRFKENDTWWDMPETETLEVQEQYRQANPWEDKISYVIMGKETEGVTLFDVAKTALDMEPKEIQGATMHRIGACLRALGWENTPKWDSVLQRATRRWMPIKK